MKGEIKLAQKLLNKYPELNHDPKAAKRYARVLLTIGLFNQTHNYNIVELSEKLKAIK